MCVAGCVAVSDTVEGGRAVRCLTAGAYGNQLQCVAVCVAACVAVSVAAGRCLAAGAYGSQLRVLQCATQCVMQCGAAGGKRAVASCSSIV